MIGFFSLLTEAMLGIPQLMKNLRNRSTEGMRYTLFKFRNIINVYKSEQFAILGSYFTYF